MIRVKLTKQIVENAQAGETDAILWDTEVKGFGLKVTPKGKRSYFVYYRSHDRRQRRPFIGAHGTITCEQARKIAKEWLAEVAAGGDPSADRKTKRNAPTVAQLAERYLSEHARPKKRASSVRMDETNLRLHILPALGNLKVASVTRSDVNNLHHAMRATPGAANRVLSLISKMFNLAEKWDLRRDGSNPCRHVDRYPEKKLERYLNEVELGRLSEALAESDLARIELPSVTAAIRLLLFTGARLSEILTLQWDYVDIENACLRLPESKTGAKVIYLAAPALKVLNGIRRVDGSPWVIPGRDPSRPLVNLRKPWYRIRARAGLEDVRIHDLRHSFASMAVAGGLSLPMIGALLGHSQPATTARYAHLAGDPLRQAANITGGRIAAAMGHEK